ncbi:MAG: hypothetical protein IPJ76_02250 [Flavobacteriales bacterium]|nr:MAG: hypothetical protein IPJ76_02250 [Flavobacteriales bacterium]
MKLYLPFAAVVVFILGMLALDRDQPLLFAVPLAIALSGLVVAWRRDRSVDAVYMFDGKALALRTARDGDNLDIASIADVSLIDRSAARDYVLQRTRDMEPIQSKQVRRDFVRYCTVDIGLTSYSFGFGRRMIDGMQDAKRDLVLVRLRDGGALLLSPQYNHDLVDSVGRVLHIRNAG